MTRKIELPPTRLEQALSDGRPVLGPFCKMGEPMIYELAGLAGFDFAIIDMEHGALGFETALNLVRTCEGAGISPVIRVPANRPELVQRALDIGAHAVQVPEINSAEQARQLVEAARYHPEGRRGVCRFVRAARYADIPKADYFPYANRMQKIIAHIEGKEGFENLDAILAVGGIDVIFIGPYDLSQSLGIPGQVDHPRLRKTMSEIVRRSRAANAAVGTFVESPRQAAAWIRQGVTYVSYSVDVELVRTAFASVVASVKRVPVGP